MLYVGRATLDWVYINIVIVLSRHVPPTQKSFDLSQSLGSTTTADCKKCSSPSSKVTTRSLLNNLYNEYKRHEYSVLSSLRTGRLLFGRNEDDHEEVTTTEKEYSRMSNRTDKPGCYCPKLSTTNSQGGQMFWKMFIIQHS